MGEWEGERSKFENVLERERGRGRKYASIVEKEQLKVSLYGSCFLTGVVAC